MQNAEVGDLGVLPTYETSPAQRERRNKQKQASKQARHGGHLDRTTQLFGPLGLGPETVSLVSHTRVERQFDRLASRQQALVMISTNYAIDAKTVWLKQVFSSKLLCHLSHEM